MAQDLRLLSPLVQLLPQFPLKQWHTGHPCLSWGDRGPRRGKSSGPCSKVHPGLFLPPQSFWRAEPENPLELIGGAGHAGPSDGHECTRVLLVNPAPLASCLITEGIEVGGLEPGATTSCRVPPRLHSSLWRMLAPARASVSSSVQGRQWGLAGSLGCLELCAGWHL